VKIAIFGSYNGTSVGDTAILLGLLRAIGSTVPGADVTVLTTGPIDLSRDIALVDPAAQPRLMRANAWTFQELPVLRSVLWRIDRGGRLVRRFGMINVERCRSVLSEQDLLVIGGGNLLMDLFEENVRVLETICGAAQTVSTPYVFLGVGAGPIDSQVSRNRLAKCVAGAKAVWVRDDESMTLCRDHLGRKDARKAPDLAFALKASAHGLKRGVLALNAAALGSTTWPWQDQRKFDSYIGGFVRLARAAAVRFVPDRVEIVSTNGGVDHRATHEIASALTDGPLALDFPVSVTPCDDVTGVLAAFSRAGVAITTRLHAGILASLAGCRVLPVAYDEKVRAVLEGECIATESVQLEMLDDLDWLPDRHFDLLGEAPLMARQEIGDEVFHAVRHAVDEAA
jgi:polysaccharide pyruvyl transferase WcaK-like protein